MHLNDLSKFNDRVFTGNFIYWQLQRRQEDDAGEIRQLQAQLETERKQYETEVCLGDCIRNID
jgi:hypothetical protein